MSQVLYRLYRPQKFSDVVGQEHVITTLTNQLKNRQTAHAYLFTGSRGVGKTSIARLLARAINCSSPLEHEPDNTCDICMEISEGRSLDFTEIDAASHTGVDNIREIIEHLAMPPTRAKYRTFIIDEVHMLSRGAFNALLKTLEEPPAHALFILATTEVHKIPATIISRTQRFDFKKLTEQQIVDRLNTVAKSEGLEVEDEIVRAVAEASEGGLRDALMLLEKAVHLSAEQGTDSENIQRLLGITPLKYRRQLLELITAKDLRAVASFIAGLTEQGYNLEQFTRDFLQHLRTTMSENMSSELALISENFLEAYQQLRYSPVTELPLMVAAIKSIQSAPEMTARLKAKDQAEPVKIMEPISKPPAKSSAPLEMHQVEEKWMDVLGRIKQYNQSLLAALKLAKPVSITGGHIAIAFPYKFHADTVNAAKNRLVIERVFEEVFSKKFTVECIVQKGAQTEAEPAPAENKKAPSALLQSALDVFGGEVVA